MINVLIGLSVFATLVAAIKYPVAIFGWFVIYALIMCSFKGQRFTGGPRPPSQEKQDVGKPNP